MWNTVTYVGHRSPSPYGWSGPVTLRLYFDTWLKIIKLTFFFSKIDYGALQFISPDG